MRLWVSAQILVLHMSQKFPQGSLCSEEEPHHILAGKTALRRSTGRVDFDTGLTAKTKVQYRGKSKFPAAIKRARQGMYEVCKGSHVDAFVFLLSISGDLCTPRSLRMSQEPSAALYLDDRRLQVSEG